MAAKREMAYYIKLNTDVFWILPTWQKTTTLIRVCEQGFTFKPCSSLLTTTSEYEVGGCVSTFVASCINFALIQLRASPLFGCLTLTSAGISLPFRFESLLCFLTNRWLFSLSQRPFRGSRRSCRLRSLEPGSVLSDGNYCSSLFTLLLKTLMSLALVTFWYFLVRFIHSNTFLF